MMMKKLWVMLSILFMGLGVVAQDAHAQSSPYVIDGNGECHPISGGVTYGAAIDLRFCYYAGAEFKFNAYGQCSAVYAANGNTAGPPLDSVYCIKSSIASGAQFKFNAYGQCSAFNGTYTYGPELNIRFCMASGEQFKVNAYGQCCAVYDADGSTVGPALSPWFCISQGNNPFPDPPIF